MINTSQDRIANCLSFRIQMMMGERRRPGRAWGLNALCITCLWINFILENCFLPLDDLTFPLVGSSPINKFKNFLVWRYFTIFSAYLTKVFVWNLNVPGGNFSRCLSGSNQPEQTPFFIVLLLLLYLPCSSPDLTCRMLVRYQSTNRVINKSVLFSISSRY